MNARPCSLRVPRWLCGAIAAWLLLAQSVNAAPPDRIFADGFEPCCRIGGTVSGLAAAGLVLHLDADTIHADKPVAGNGLYGFFAAAVPPGTAYSLSISAQPSGQTCAFTISAGTMGNSTIENADVICTGNLSWDSGNWGSNWN